VGSNPTPRTTTEHTAILVGYMTYLLSKKSLKTATVKRKTKIIKSLLRHGCNLFDADTVVKFLNTCDWASGTKYMAIDAYRDYLNMIGLSGVKLPRFRRVEKLPFIPLESELDSLVCNARSRMYSFLSILKDTACRPIKAWTLKWVDLDLVNRCVTANSFKYSHPRKLRISGQTINLVSALPKRNQYIFSPSGEPERFSYELEHFTLNFARLRKRVASKLVNQRLTMITLRTFRHWKATTEYVRTRDIIHVKMMLGHFSITNTMKYIHLASAISNLEDGYVCRVVKSVDEAKTLIESGFEYVTEIDGFSLFRKRK